jgi:hypothetical protein
MVFVLTEIILSRNPLTRIGWITPVIISYLYAALCAMLKRSFAVEWPYFFMYYIYDVIPWWQALIITVTSDLKAGTDWTHCHTILLSFIRNCQVS